MRAFFSELDFVKSLFPEYFLNSDLADNEIPAAPVADPANVEDVNIDVDNNDFVFFDVASGKWKSKVNFSSVTAVFIALFHTLEILFWF